MKRTKSKRKKLLNVKEIDDRRHFECNELYSDRSKLCLKRDETL